MNFFVNVMNRFKNLPTASTIKFIKHFYIIILTFILNTNVCFAGDNSDSILYFMIGLMIVSATGVVYFIVYETKKKGNK